MKKRVNTLTFAGISSLTASLFVGSLAAQTDTTEKKTSGVINHSAFNSLRDSQKQPLELKGAKVAAENRAKELTFNRYVDLMLHRRGISATEEPRVVGIDTLGCDVPGYAKKGDVVWEVHMVDFMSGLNAIAWVHSATEEVKFLLLPVPVPETKK